MKLEECFFWIAMPTVMLTENGRKRWIRVLGIMGMLPLFPLAIVGLFLLLIVAAKDLSEEI